jgi:catechol 2,3-dioxygenase-like lactoylglutathione lyase family enzyme
MNLPDAPIAHEGFFVTHFFTVRDQEKSKDFYVRILGGKVIKPENPCYIKWQTPRLFSIPAAAPHATSPRSSSKLRRI